MPANVIEESQRIPALSQLGVSPALLQMASGQLPHPALASCTSGPPYYLYHGAVAPAGPPVLALWDIGDQVIAIRVRTSGREYICFSIEAPDEVEPLATTEQGFWATQFDFMYELDMEIETLHAVAEAVGYRFLPMQLDSRAAMEARPDAAHRHGQWLSELVASIDAAQPTY
ncbi:hypothetical protein [Lysobacter capsici]|uniref:hypothetical protein n=1 Tax=Lysobacter capsici TaxID=435897 RepID=UPI001C005A02|nr:hypothetical protein [Lysobacter capsici]QWF15101.1 hypothetical protein KME82_14965 [Lysobacter capsici]